MIEKELILQYFAHVSRLYSSTINAIITTIFGWLSFNAVLIGLISSKVNLQVMPLATVFWILIIPIEVFLYVRTLHFGRIISSMTKDLEEYKFETYINSLKGINWYHKMNLRPELSPQRWTKAEKIGVMVYCALFVTPIVSVLILAWQNGYIKL
jgi:hypothetical protein